MDSDTVSVIGIVLQPFEDKLDSSNNINIQAHHNSENNAREQPGEGGMYSDSNIPISVYKSG